LEYARKFYDCPDLAGVPLENNDDDTELIVGSHWEKNFLPMELMNPMVELQTPISEFTLKFFEDTQWFSVSFHFSK
jgi:hypothetical protein